MFVVVNGKLYVYGVAAHFILVRASVSSILSRTPHAKQGQLAAISRLDEAWNKTKHALSRFEGLCLMLHDDQGILGRGGRPGILTRSSESLKQTTQRRSLNGTNDLYRDNLKHVPEIPHRCLPRA